MNKNDIKVQLYDCYEKKVVEARRGDCLIQYGFDKWRLDDLISGVNKHIHHRYLKIQDVSAEIITLINISTGEEYECFTPLSFLRQIKKTRITEQEAACVSSLMRNHISKTCIENVFYKKRDGKILKGHIFEGREGFTLFDIFKNEIIEIKCGELSKKCRELGFDYTNLYKLGKSSKCINDRFILPETRQEVFTLIDVNTGEEFNCITNNSLFLQLNIPHSYNYSKYLYALKIQRQKTVTIAGRIFKLKAIPLVVRNLLSQKKSSKEREIIHNKRKLKHKIATNLRGRLRCALLRKRAKKSNKTLDLTGCSIEFLIAYLEQQFQPGMTWDNYGYGMDKWNVDHIKCCNSFDLTKEEQQRECFHYSNLQPMWQIENFSKSGKTVEEWEIFKKAKRY